MGEQKEGVAECQGGVAKGTVVEGENKKGAWLKAKGAWLQAEVLDGRAERERGERARDGAKEGRGVMGS